MGSDKLELSGIVGAVSKQAGVVVGTSVAISKKIAGSGFRSVTAVRDMVTRPIRKPAPVTDEKIGPTPERSALKPRAEKSTARKRNKATVRESKKATVRKRKKTRAQKRAVGKPVAPLESDLDMVRQDLEKANSGVKEAKSQLSSDVNVVQTKGGTVLSYQSQEKIAAVSAEDEVESLMEVAAAQPDEGKKLRVAEVEAPSPPDAILAEVDVAAFPSAADRIIFKRALSDISSRDAGVRADAARVIAGVCHELSVKALVAQMASEPLPQVRQECIKALMTLKMKEGLNAVKRALTDQAASVRLAAVWALYNLDGVESAPDLVGMFSDENEGVRRRAATCIGWLGQEKLAVKLLPLLADNSFAVRRAAVEAMANIGSRQVVSGLIEHLNDPEKSVRKAITGALKTITGKKMGGPFPTDGKSLQRLILRWQEWWKEELLG